tara:strand:+ start:1815 stop:2156 length:342 start_codon:yes stop_codon:yes gene_type:complete
MTEEDSPVMTLMNALISKMEQMDARITEQGAALRNPMAILKRAGYVRTVSPASTDVWGDPLRGDVDDVISKANGVDSTMGIEMPSSNEEWHDMEWDDIHAMAHEAAIAEGRHV